MWSRWLLGIASGIALAVAAVLRMDALAVAAFAGLALAILLPAHVLQHLFARLRRAGPLEFDPWSEPSVKEALDAAPQEVRAKAEAEARRVGERLGKAMNSLGRFANETRAEIAALGVRTTAVEEELLALIARVRELEAKYRQGRAEKS